MGMPDPPHRWTREEVLALPDDGIRYELIDGELLVSPSPRGLHQRAVMSLVRRVDPYVRAHGVGSTGSSPSDLDLGSGQSVQPDLYVVPLFDDGREPIDWPDYGIPLLIAEVLSSSTARQDRFTKRRLFQRSGVAEYWVVDLEARACEQWRPGDERPAILEDRVEWHPPGAAAPLIIELPEYFARFGVSGSRPNGWARAAPSDDLRSVIDAPVRK
jgi:Uma2 family endonuclease